MKIFIVMNDLESDRNIANVFATKELAETWISENRSQLYEPEIEAWTVFASTKNIKIWAGENNGPEKTCIANNSCTEKTDETTITAEPFTWNDNMSEVALEDFSMLQQNLPYCIAQNIGTALAKLQLLEAQGCTVTEK